LEKGATIIDQALEQPVAAKKQNITREAVNKWHLFYRSISFNIKVVSNGLRSFPGSINPGVLPSRQTLRSDDFKVQRSEGLKAVFWACSIGILDLNFKDCKLPSGEVVRLICLAICYKS
jgi:hypothetical protein